MTENLDLYGVTRCVLSDYRLLQRLRYIHAVRKVHGMPDSETLELLAQALHECLDQFHIDLSEAEATDWLNDLQAQAWDSGSLEENFRLLKQVRHRTR